MRNSASEKLQNRILFHRHESEDDRLRGIDVAQSVSFSGTSFLPGQDQPSEARQSPEHFLTAEHVLDVCIPVDVFDELF